jgi:hypothetical protein
VYNILSLSFQLMIVYGRTTTNVYQSYRRYDETSQWIAKEISIEAWIRAALKPPLPWLNGKPDTGMYLRIPDSRKERYVPLHYPTTLGNA